MIENFSDFLSIMILANILLVALYFPIKQLLKKRRRKIVKREIEYYRNIY